MLEKFVMLKEKLILNEKEKYVNIPPKEIFNSIHGNCFSYINYESKYKGEIIQDRIYDTWQCIHESLRRFLEADEEGFLKYVKSNPDLRKFE